MASENFAGITPAADEPPESRDDLLQRRLNEALRADRVHGQAPTTFFGSKPEEADPENGGLPVAMGLGPWHYDETGQPVSDAYRPASTRDEEPPPSFSAGQVPPRPPRFRMRGA